MYWLSYYRILPWLVSAVLCGYAVYVAISMAGAFCHVAMRRKSDTVHDSLDGAIALCASAMAGAAAYFIGYFVSGPHGEETGVVSVATLAFLFFLSDWKNWKEGMLPKAQLLGDVIGFGFVVLAALSFIWFG